MSSGDTTRVSSIGNIELRTATPGERHIEKLLYCCRIFAGCEVMTKRPCCYAVFRDPFFRVQWTQACLILTPI